jgi:hypothetical protein
LNFAVPICDPKLNFEIPKSMIVGPFGSTRRVTATDAGAACSRNAREQSSVRQANRAKLQEYAKLHIGGQGDDLH